MSGWTLIEWCTNVFVPRSKSRVLNVPQHPAVVMKCVVRVWLNIIFSRGRYLARFL